ncbi:hypothetical protein AB0I51_22340 [Streptomyces sp. NPDC050549]|uniref:hypothetical protein n=1 Tax=Streptomyces sp. NPDC050549 TaxID=3155406 RepID=UPI0034361B4E
MNTGQALGALGESFLDGMRLCLVVAGALTLLAALVCALLLRPRRAAASTAAPIAGTNTTGAATAVDAAAVEPAPNR